MSNFQRKIVKEVNEMSIRILVVDDNPDTLRAYTRAIKRKLKLTDLHESLKKGLVKIVSVDNVPEAISRLKSQPFEIIVVDLKIPGISGGEMGGLEIISESLKFDSLRPIIVITGYGSIELARKTLTQGVFDFIEKSKNASTQLVDALQRAIDIQNEKIKSTGNPFTPMTGIEPTVFGGRTSELEFLEEKLNRALYTRFCEHFLVLGDWGIGKSTLLKEYKKIIQTRGYFVSFLPLEPFLPGTKLDEVATSIIEGIIRDLPYPIDRFKKLLSYFDSIGFSILGLGFEVSRDTSKKMISPQAFMHDAILSLWQDIKDKSEVLVILFDNLENLVNVPEIILTLKQTLSMDSIKKTKILVGMATISSFWRQLISNKKHHPLSRYFLSKLELPLLNKEDVTETILKSLAGTGISFDHEIIDKIFFYTKGHPFEMQLLSYHLFKNQLSGRVKPEIFLKALEITVKDIGGAIFEQWLDTLTSEENAVLRLMAKREKPLNEEQVFDLTKINKLDFKFQDISTYLHNLLRKRFLSRNDKGMYEIDDPIFQIYIRRFR
jgi:CheY-like chemotaxis protein/GTPase SAR1 family protein